jgi:hypothetical protein
MDYLVRKGGKNIPPYELNAIFSTIYSPIVPLTKLEEVISYKKGQDSFQVHPSKKGSMIHGEISKDLRDKLTEFGVTLSLKTPNFFHMNLLNQIFK